MKLFSHLRSRSNVKDTVEAKVYERYNARARASASGNKGASGPGSTLPAELLNRIFTFVCPHSQDEAYTTLEDSTIEDGCMLCDMRDLAQCSLVCRHWKKVAQKLLYIL